MEGRGRVTSPLATSRSGSAGLAGSAETLAEGERPETQRVGVADELRQRAPRAVADRELIGADARRQEPLGEGDLRRYTERCLLVADVALDEQALARHVAPDQAIRDGAMDGEIAAQTHRTTGVIG